MVTTDQNPGTHWRHHIHQLKEIDHQFPPVHGNAALCGFACDDGIKRNNGRPGAKSGPTEIRNALAKLAWHNSNDVFDCGNIFCENGDLETAQKQFGDKISLLLNTGYFPIGIGGGHEIAYGHYLGIRQFIKNKKLGIINFDAHFDMRTPINSQSTSGTSFYQIAQHCQQHDFDFAYNCIGIKTSSNMHSLFETAQKHGAQWVTAEELNFSNLQVLKTNIEEFCSKVDHIYITFCLDVFNVAIAPGVSAINPTGPSWEPIMALCEHIFSSNKVIAMDIAELNPVFDIDHRTARLAAEIIFKACERKGF